MWQAALEHCSLRALPPLRDIDYGFEAASSPAHARPGAEIFFQEDFPPARHGRDRAAAATLRWPRLPRPTRPARQSKLPPPRRRAYRLFAREICR